MKIRWNILSLHYKCLKWTLLVMYSFYVTNVFSLCLIYKASNQYFDIYIIKGVYSPQKSHDRIPPAGHLELECAGNRRGPPVLVPTQFRFDV